MKRIFDFCCPEGHITERLVDDTKRTILCGQPGCMYESTRLVSAPQIRLEGITGQFPGAYDKWERTRAEKLAQERKMKSIHGEPD